LISIGGGIYLIRIKSFENKKEGVFLAGCLWVAQYYVMLKDLKKAKTIIDAVLQFTTDLGFLPEEGDVKTGELLGNIPQTFVHSSLMGVILDYNAALNSTANE
jgi:GH15 family glucan-1,4-alpha-glucosidase